MSDASIRQAIDIAVQVSGRAAVGDIQREITNLNNVIGVYKAQLAAGSLLTDEFVTKTAAAKDELKRLGDNLKLAQASLRGSSAAMTISGNAALQLSYAIDDIQYGFSAIVNNAPGIVAALGGSAGLAGGMGIAFVAANVLIKAIGGQQGLEGAVKTLGREMNLVSDPIRDATRSLEGMKSQIDAINDKPFKVAVDYASMRTLQLELDKSNKLLREYENLKNRDSEDKAAAKDLIAKGIANGGGKTNLEDALLEISKKNGTFGAGSELHGKVAEQQSIVDFYKPAMSTTAMVLNPIAGGVARLRTAQAEAEIATLRDQMEKEQRDKGASLLGLGQGEGSRKALEDILLDPKNAGILAQHGVTNEAKLGVIAASPENMQAAKDNKKAAKEQEQDARDAERRNRKAQADEAENIRHEQKTKANAERAAKQAQAAKEAEGVWQIQQDDRIKRENAAKARANDAAFKKAARGAPKRAEQGRQAFFGRQFQDATGANDAQAETAGKMMAGMVDRGASPRQAMAATYKRLLAQMEQMGQINRQLHAEMLMNQGFAEEAVAMFQQLNAKMGATARFGGRSQVRRNSFMPTLGGN